MSTIDTTTRFDAFPDAPVPTTLPEALALLEETRRLLAEECRKRATIEAEHEQVVAAGIGLAVDLSATVRELAAEKGKTLAAIRIISTTSFASASPTVTRRALQQIEEALS